MKEHLRNDCKDSISVWHIFIPCVTWADFNNAVKISSTLHKQTHYFWLCAAFPACHGSKESCKRWGGGEASQTKWPDIWKKAISISALRPAEKNSVLKSYQWRNMSPEQWPWPRGKVGYWRSGSAERRGGACRARVEKWRGAERKRQLVHSSPAVSPLIYQWLSARSTSKLRPDWCIEHFIFFSP